MGLAIYFSKGAGNYHTGAHVCFVKRIVIFITRKVKGRGKLADSMQVVRREGGIFPVLVERVRGNCSSIWLKSELIKIRRKEKSRMNKRRMDWNYNKTQLVPKHQPFISCFTHFPMEGIITRSCFRKVPAGSFGDVGWRAHYHSEHHPGAGQQLDGTAGCAITLLHSQQRSMPRLSAWLAQTLFLLKAVALGWKAKTINFTQKIQQV